MLTLETQEVPSMIPDYLANADAEERAELAALGIDGLETAPAEDQASRDAFASRLLRGLQSVEREIAERKAAHQREVEFVTRLYVQQIERLEARAAYLTDGIKGLALVSDFGTKKSRDVGFGTYGVRRAQPTITITNEGELVEWARGHAQETLLADLTLDYAAAMQLPETVRGALKTRVSKKALNARVLSEASETVPGVHVNPAHDEPFAKTREALP